jgi:proline racemase
MTEPVTRFRLEAPVGLIDIEAQCANGKAVSVKLHNAPSFVGALDVQVDVPEIGKVPVDIVFGGMWCVLTSLMLARWRRWAHVVG